MILVKHSNQGQRTLSKIKLRRKDTISFGTYLLSGQAPDLGARDSLPLCQAVGSWLNSLTALSVLEARQVTASITGEAAMEIWANIGEPTMLGQHTQQI